MHTVVVVLAFSLVTIGLLFAVQAAEPAATPGPPDYSVLQLKGDGMKQDSFSLAVQAAARCLGRDADYESICCLSANAFAPALDLGEGCTAWWQCEAVTGDKCIQTVADRLGLAARRLVFPDFKVEASSTADDLLRFRKAMAPIIRQARDAGAVVVCLDGWDPESPKGFVPWCWGGVITEARDDGTILGASLNGRTDNPLKWPGRMWALTAAQPSLTAEAADAVVLTQALARIRGTKPFEQEGKVVYGLAAMDAWMKHMSEVPGFCGPCEGREKKGWTCAQSTAQTVIGGARTAASYLRKRLPSLPESARPHVEAAAANYSRIVELLLPAATAKDDRHYAKFVGDLEKQKAYAEAVLKSARAELASAADSLEKALAVLGGAAGAIKVEPRILQMEAMKVLGVLRRVNFKTGPSVRSVWDGDFMTFHDKIKPQSTDGFYYGVAYPTAEENVIDYLAGMSVKAVPDVPEGLVLRTVPTGRYAVFEFSFEQQTKGGPEYAQLTWLPASGYERDRTVDSANFTRFGQGPVLFSIPIREAAPAKLRPAPDALELELPAAKRRTWNEGFAGPGGLRALMQFIGEDSGFRPNGDWWTTEIFPLFMGVYGDAFRFIWFRQDLGARQPGDSFVACPPTPCYLAALDAAGFDARVVIKPGLGNTPPALPWDTATLRREIVASIAERRWPVLVTGLPEPGWNAVITGYEKGGDVLLGWCAEGWDNDGIRFDPAKKQKFTDWFPKAASVVLLTARHARPPEAEVFRAALARAVPDLRMRAVGHLHAGPATFEVLAKRLDDPSLSTDDTATAKRRNDLLNPMIWDLATQRYYASLFLKRAAEVLPAGAEELKAASGLFKAIHDAVWELNRVGGSEQPGTPLPKLIDPAVRKQIAEIILKCRDRDLEAAQKIEEALAKVKPAEPARR